ncbi:modulator of drug activity B [Francisella tularensis subsp. novicida GA99-3548]|uniref:NAD(P)H-dependent oxidoreductase n=1 Tax=Francisella tularensis TaxID=263 RepID=UPI000158B16D|nr:NAD(P)H-dependent oxidoreductase [Francisella tularensis]AJI73641.1 flavodoxin-like fold family protein [Francisella tularensis subsp. novicida D9876]EDN37627.1 modulator of drug activity B [Francisella tularensis subsp. novicida GA99-3548]
MKKILLINGKKEFGHSKGALNQYLNDIAYDHLKSLGHDVKLTIVDDGYNIDDEIQKWLWADTIIYQMPGWWMGPPWIVKKYIDEVFTTGHGVMYASDGRSRYDTSKKYGSGGLLHGKTYMLSLTWNAPFEAFVEKDQLFEGVGVDGVYLHFHKAHEFIGMKRLPTFIANDVMKNPLINEFTLSYKNHLDTVFRNAR